MTETKAHIHPLPWTDDRIDILKSLWADGYSCSQIAAQLGGTSRNAVIGKVHRLNLAGRAVITRKTYAMTSRASKGIGASGPRTRTRDRFIVINAETGEQTDIRSLENEPKPLTGDDGALIGVLEIERGQCRWPHGDPHRLTEFHFCAHPVHEESVYCRHHRSRAIDAVRTEQSHTRAKDYEQRQAA